MNLVDCHEEKIHISGHIQDFGYIIGLDPSTKTIAFFSQNISEIFNADENVLGETLEQNSHAFAPLLESVVLGNLEFEKLKDVDVFLDKISINDVNYHLTIYRYEGMVFLEIEKVIEHFHTRTFVSKKYESISSATTSAEIWEQLLNSIAEAIDYDRVMVYRFLEDGSGKVIAEKLKNDVESYLNLHYPESDIPRQARDLYLKKRKRIFSNVSSAPVPIISKLQEPVNLTYSTLRAMSPVHGQYLKNAGAESSFSTSIVVDNKLWGMVTCQNTKAKHIDLVNRIRSEVFTVIAANAYASYKTRQILNDSIELESHIKKLKTALLQHNTVESSLFANIESMRDYPAADGLAVVVGQNIRTSGFVPSNEDILQIVQYARENPLKNFYSTNDFSNALEGNMSQMVNAAGVMFGFTDDERNELMIWFRREIDTQLLWAGNPSKDTTETVLNGDQQYVISPRKSFATYIENIKGKATPWKNRDVIAAKRVVAAILETTYSQFRKVQELNDELRNLNEELDSFSYTISHDLGTPLTVMKLNAQLLERAHHDNPEVRKRVGSILAEIVGMESMMRGVLELSKAKSTEIELKELETASTIRKICLEAQLTISETTEVVIGKTPNVLADETMMRQVFLNIIGNAVKYSSKSANPKIEIHGREEGDKVIYSVKDNGIGIPAKDQAKMFKIFSRMENAKGFQGNGVGLSIVFRIMKRLGGDISYESTAEKETVFKLTFQNPRTV
jgi:light-regulated signal transduction histidine kinase (bacteriophytochrome)